jgi:hypothetical protein
MRWGITEEMATEICLEEVEKCHKQSIGPAFVVIFVLITFPSDHLLYFLTIMLTEILIRVLKNNNNFLIKKGFPKPSIWFKMP